MAKTFGPRVLSGSQVTRSCLTTLSPMFQWFLWVFYHPSEKNICAFSQFCIMNPSFGAIFFQKKNVKLMKLPAHIVKHLKISIIFSKSTGSNLGTFLNKSWKPECSWGFLGDSLTFHHHFFRWVTHPVGIKGWNFPLPTSDSLRCCKMGEGGGMRPAAARVALPSWRTSSWSENIRSRGFECVSYIFLYVLWGTVYI